MEDKNIITSNTRHVACDGGKGELGHPKVYLEIKKGLEKAVCPYCSQTFVYKEEK